MPNVSQTTSKRTICLTPEDERQIAQIQANCAPFEVKTHHVIRMALRRGLAALLEPQSTNSQG